MAAEVRPVRRAAVPEAALPPGSGRTPGASGARCCSDGAGNETRVPAVPQARATPTAGRITTDRGGLTNAGATDAAGSGRPKRSRGGGGGGRTANSRGRGGRKNSGGGGGGAKRGPTNMNTGC